MLKRTGLGVLAGILFMAAEGLGSLYLIRALLQGSDGSEASQFTLVTYLWLAFNVMGASLGFVAARAAARLDHRDHLAALSVNVKHLAWRMLLPAGLAVLIALLFMVLLGQLPVLYAAAWAGFVLGHLLRLLGLVRIFIHVGDGHLGADKWYQLSFSLLFYLVAIPLAQHGLSIGWIASAYVLSALLTWMGSAVWRRGRLPSTQDSNPAPVDSPRALGRQSLSMIGFAAAGFLAGNADAMVARALLADHAFVQYAIAAKLGQVVALVAGLIPAMFGPRITRFHQARQWSELRHARRTSLALAMGVGAAGAMLLVALQDPVAQLLSPGRHDVLSSVLWIVAAGAVLQAASLALSNAVNSVAGSGLVLVTLVSAFVAVPVSAGLGWQHGALGVATGTVVGSVAMLIGLHQVTRRAFRVEAPPVP